MNDDERGSAGLADLLRFARRRWVWVVVPALTVALLAGVLSASRPDLYKSSAKLAVQPPSTATEAERALFGETDLPSQLALIQSAPVLREALRAARLPDTDEAVREFQTEYLEVEQAASSPAFEISVQHPDPEASALLAQGVAEQYLAFLDREAGKRLARAVQELRAADVATREQLRSLEAQVASRPGKTAASLEEERDELYAQLRFSAARVIELQTVKAFARLGYVLEPAATPGGPSSPRPVRDALLGLVVGGLLGVGFAYVRERSDDSVRDAAEVRQAGAGALLGVVGVRSAGPGSAASDVDLDSLRQVRTCLTARDRVDRRGISWVSLPGSRRNNASVELALLTSLADSLARTGRTVILVDAAVGSTPLRPGSSPGLGDLLAGAQSDPFLLLERSESGVQVLHAGSQEERTADLLGGPRFRQVLEQLAATADHLIVRGPSLAHGAAVVDVAAAAGAAVLVAPVGVSGGSLAEAIARLHAVGVQPVGTVLWDTAGRRRPLSRSAGGSDQRPAGDRHLVG